MIVHSISPFTNPVNSRRSFFSYICGCLEKANVKVDPKIDSLSHSKAYLSSLYLDQFMLRKSPVIYSDKFSSYKHLFEYETPIHLRVFLVGHIKFYSVDDVTLLFKSLPDYIKQENSHIISLLKVRFKDNYSVSFTDFNSLFLSLKSQQKISLRHVKPV